MVIEDLQKLVDLQPGIIVSYVFCSYQRHEANHDELLPRSLLRMLLLEQLPLIPDDIMVMYRASNQSSCEAGIGEIFMMLEISAERKSHSFFIVDALDELKSEHRESLVSHLHWLQSKAGVDLFFTSRKMSKIEGLFLDVMMVQINATEDDV